MREDQTLVSVIVAGRNLGTFETKTGGAKDSDETKIRPGGGAGPVSLGGPVSVENVTVMRTYRRDRDQPLMGFLYSQVGKGEIKVVEQDLDDDNNAYGKPLTFKGKVKQVSGPDADSNSNDARKLTIEASTDGTIA